eukprot:COSAG01_NODE_1445_length_10281_cov_33.445099_19_plen_263_part_00
MENYTCWITHGSVICDTWGSSLPGRSAAMSHLDVEVQISSDEDEVGTAPPIQKPKKAKQKKKKPPNRATQHHDVQVMVSSDEEEAGEIQKPKKAKKKKKKPPNRATQHHDVQVMVSSDEEEAGAAPPVHKPAEKKKAKKPRAKKPPKPSAADLELASDGEDDFSAEQISQITQAKVKVSQLRNTSESDDFTNPMHDFAVGDGGAARAGADFDGWGGMAGKKGRVDSRYFCIRRHGAAWKLCSYSDRNMKGKPIQCMDLPGAT